MMIDGVKIAVGTVLATVVICGVVLGHRSKPVPSLTITEMTPRERAIREAILTAQISPADQLEELRSRAGTNVILLQVEYNDTAPLLDSITNIPPPSDGDTTCGLNYKLDITEIRVSKSNGSL